MDEYSSRLKRLEENLRELERFRGTSTDDLEGRQKRWALRYGMLESIQAIIDIACAVVSRYNLGYPDSYADCFRVLRRENVLPDDLTDRLTQAVGMRNVLVHEYLDVDDKLLLDALDRLSDFRAFAEAIRHGTPPSRDNN
ncbi:MAG: DUF86 domain-containing protein [Bacteroidetes bacterium SW_8_64_56]|nr:MAG: DUF86 domain-containing protein [Bacteroidetes bacterium SW_8_64_56]